MREINLDQLINNYNEMINLLEYDSMRSAGKAKINAQTLNSLHQLRDRYQQESNSVKAPTTKKKEAN